MNWEPIYALLIAFSTVTTWGCAKLMSQKSKSKLWLMLCLTINLAILFFYKYLNFVTESIWDALTYCGLRAPMPHFDVLLPVGISFYTFQAIGYTIDVYKGTLKAERSLLTYALFVSFFPQLVAGPIERAKNLLPQFHIRRVFNANNFIEGFKLMVWGYFMKLCIAETVAPYVNAVFNNLPNHNGYSVILATFFFTFQIFCDFGGYSLIAIGAAKCLGFSLMQNFKRPYLSLSMKEFWRRWHISLSTWFMDYVYIPLGGSRCARMKHYYNLFVTMLISGIWHGANWTFVLWGGYHGVLLVISTMRGQVIQHKIITTPVTPMRKVFSTCGCILFTFVLSMLGWILFRANTLDDILLAIRKIFSQSGMLYKGEGMPSILLPIALIALLMFKEVKDEFGFRWHFMHHKSPVISCASTAMMIVLILLCARFESGQFIYFQF